MDWSQPRHLSVDTDVLRRDLLRAIHPWTASQADGDFASELRSGIDIDVVSPLRNEVASRSSDSPRCIDVEGAAACATQTKSNASAASEIGHRD